MINFDITEYNFSKKDTDQYQLSILYGVDSFAYSVHDAGNTVLALREYLWPETRQLVLPGEEDEKLHYRYRRVHVSFGKGLFCMVPQRLYQETEKATYLGHQSVLTNSANIRSDNLPQHQAELIYEVDDEALRHAERYFPGAAVKNLHTVLLQAIRSHAITQPSYHLAVHVNHKQLLIYAFDRTNLMLANSYNYRSAQDFIYYVLLVYEQLGLKTDQTPLYLGGRILEDSDIHRLMQRYVKQFFFLPVPKVKRGPQLERYPEYFFYDLFALAGS